MQHHPGSWYLPWGLPFQKMVALPFPASHLHMQTPSMHVQAMLGGLPTPLATLRTFMTQPAQQPQRKICGGEKDKGKLVDKRKADDSEPNKDIKKDDTDQTFSSDTEGESEPLLSSILTESPNGAATTEENIPLPIVEQAKEETDTGGTQETSVDDVTKNKEVGKTSETPSTSGIYSASQRSKQLFKSPKASKSSKRKKMAGELADERQEEAYVVMKQLLNKKPRNRFQIFGELVADKIERFKTEESQNTVEHLINNILYEASLGRYDQSSSCHSPLAYYSTPAFSAANQRHQYYSSFSNASSTPSSITVAPSTMPSPTSHCGSETPNYSYPIESLSSPLQDQESTLSSAIATAMSGAGINHDVFH